MFRLAIVVSLIATTAWGSVGEITASTGPGQIKRQTEKFDGGVGTGLRDAGYNHHTKRCMATGVR